MRLTFGVEVTSAIQKILQEEGLQIVKFSGREMKIFSDDEIKELILDKVDVVKNQFKVQGADDHYTVMEYESGLYTCNCPVFTFRNSECHHIKCIKVRVTDVKPVIIMARVIEPMVLEGKLLLPLTPLRSGRYLSDEVKKTAAYLLERLYSVYEVKEKLGIDMRSGKFFEAVAPFLQKRSEITL